MNLICGGYFDGFFFIDENIAEIIIKKLATPINTINIMKYSGFILKVFIITEHTAITISTVS
jgi:hypothetical protein